MILTHSTEVSPLSSPPESRLNHFPRRNFYINNRSRFASSFEKFQRANTVSKCRGIQMKHTYLIYKNFLSLWTCSINRKWIYMWVYPISDICPMRLLLLRVCAHMHFVWMHMYMCVRVYIYTHISNKYIV